MSRPICPPTALFTERQDAAHAAGLWRGYLRHMLCGWQGDIGAGNGDSDSDSDLHNNHRAGHALKAPHGC